MSAGAAEALTGYESQQLSLAYFANPDVFDVVVNFAITHQGHQQALVGQLADYDATAIQLAAAQQDYEAAHQAARIPFGVEPSADKDQLEAEHRAKGVASMHAKAALGAEKIKVTEVGDELSIVMAGFCAARTRDPSITLLGRTYNWAEEFIVEYRSGSQVPYGTTERHVAYKMQRLHNLTPKQAAGVRIGTVELSDWSALLHRLDLVTRFAMQ